MENTMSREDYIEVSERIQKFYERYPDGSLQGTWGWLDDAHNVIVYRAEAYKTPGDGRPGIGYASEPYPGLTSFTRNSEIMNAETSAWGRAIAALGIAVNRGIASAQEVRAAQRGADTKVERVTGRIQSDPWQSGPLPEVGHKIVGASKLEPATDKQLNMIVGKLKNISIDRPDTILQYVNAVMAENNLEQFAGLSTMSKNDASKVIQSLMANPAATPP